MDLTTLRLCQVSTGREDDWISLYESAFPEAERVTVERIRTDIADGKRVLHRTLGPKGELLAFSILYQFNSFAWMSYIASDSTSRSLGIGSKHLARLIELLKEQSPKKLGLFFDIESTTAEGIDDATRAVRNRRRQFYLRLGAKSLPEGTQYFMANFLEGKPPIAAELMWFEFGAKCNNNEIRGVIRAVYENVYHYSPDDPLIERVTSQI